MNLPRIAAILFASIGLTLSSWSDVLYQSDFESFTPGADNLAGSDGWLSTRDGESLHGIDDEILPGLGNSAYLGFYPPASTSVSTVSVFRPLNYDPIQEGTPIIEFEALIAIADSQDEEGTPADESLRKDRFLVTVYNFSGEPLASIIYDNRTNTYGLYRNNGTNSFDTGFEFVLEIPQFLFLKIDMANNSWSASLNGAPLFTDALFNSSGRDLNLGTIAVEWDISNRFFPGSNWILFDDWFIDAKSRLQPATEPFRISKIESAADNKAELTYPADEGYSYTIQFSSDLKTWTDLTDSPLVPITSDSGAKYLAEKPASTSGKLYYRILRAASN